MAGVGYLVRKHGLTIDDLLAAGVVTADGRLLRVDDQRHPDLFWAVRGGGGNFGVATRFQLRLHPVSTIVGGMLILPATPEVIAGFITKAQAAPEELSAIANVMPAPPLPFLPAELHGQLIVMAMLVYAGDPEAGERAVAPFRKLATPLADLVRPMPYPEIYPPEEGDYHPTAVGHTMFVDSIDRQAAEAILDHLQRSDASVRVAQLRVLGGAMARCRPTQRRSPTATAGSWSTWPPSTTAPPTGPSARPGLRTSRRRFARATPARTSASSATRARRGSARPTPGRPGTGWRRSRPATIPPTYSGSTRTSPRRPRIADRTRHPR